MVTIQELSERCGVSVSTVSKALNGYTDISIKTKELVIRTANEIGYFPNANARALKLKKTYNLGVLFATHTTMGLRNDYFAHILSAFREEAGQYGYDITFIESHIGKRKMSYLEHCRYRHFDGVCIVCADYEAEQVLQLINSDLPVVTIDCEFEKASAVMSDNLGGMKQLTQHIIRQGHRKIAYIHGVKTGVTKNRIEGFRQTLEYYGIPLPEEYLREGFYRNPMEAEKLALELLDLKEIPTCIIAPDDQSAVGVVSAIRKKGLQVVKDISVAGYDGLDLQQLVGIKITSVKQERDKIGQEAARQLVKLIEKPEKSYLATNYLKQTLLLGNSVRKIN